ncbi:MAG: pectate lyase, partial [Defluviitaleaceae bacterium]|nr:pectate lyase [Defluviitaleaceae bacterium]
MKIKFIIVFAILLSMFAVPAYASEWTNYNFRNASRNNDSWFASAEGRRVADAIVQHQLRDGGWRADMAIASSGNWNNSTLDNDASSSQIIILARAFRANPTRTAYRDAMNRGIDWLLDGQLAAGGWPLIFNTFTNVTSYHRHNTFNDNASVYAGRIMLDVGYNQGNFRDIVDTARQTRARASVKNFTEFIIASQIRGAGGRLTAWPQQAHITTLVPEWGREFEPPAISASESSGVILFLRDLPNELRCQRVADAHNAATRWYRDVEIRGIRVEQSSDDRWIVSDANARELWARLYRISDNVPIFGDRAQFRPGVDYRLSMAELSQERRRGYAWYGNWGRNVYNLSDLTAYAGTQPTLLQGTLIRDLNRLDLANASHWSIRTNAQVGDEIFGCRRTFTFTALPESVRGSEWLKVSGDSKDFSGENLATFIARENITVHVGLDSRVVSAHGLPSWLSDWTRQTGIEARTNDGTNNIIFHMYTRNYNSGQTVALGTNGPGAGVMMYTVFITPQSLNGRLISEIIFLDEANKNFWSLENNLQVGDRAHGDRTNIILTVPENLRGAEWLRTSVESRSVAGNVAEFTARENISVFVGFDSRIAAPPAWLNGWTRTEKSVTATDQSNADRTIFYEIFTRDFNAGERIILGTNGQSSGILMYLAWITEKQIAPPEFEITFDFGDGNIFTTLTQNGNAIPPQIPERNGFVFGGWAGNLENVTANITVNAKWLRIGAVASGGANNVTSADIVWLARCVAKHSGFTL